MPFALFLGQGTCGNTFNCFARPFAAQKARSRSSNSLARGFLMSHGDVSFSNWLLLKFIWTVGRSIFVFLGFISFLQGRRASVDAYNTV